MQPFLRYAQQKQEAIIADIRALVESESPSDSPADINRCLDLIVAQAKDVATPKIIKSKQNGNHLRLDFKLPGRAPKGRILGIGHSDTVWPLGTLSTMPFRRENGRLWGPGVLDMKSGLSFFIHAARALRELDVPVAKRVSLLIVSEEETGSKDSRPLTEAEAQASDIVLVLEPGSHLSGDLKTARKGIAVYRLSVEGKAAHAGVDFSNGANAIVELARQLDRIAAFTDLDKGLTVNPGVVSGGTRSNVVPAAAHAEVDVRVARAKDAGTINRKIRALKPVDKRCKLAITGGLNRPPMERTQAIVGLYQLAKQLGSEMGLEIAESSTGGGSDGNFTAALGIPTLDGLGGVGEGAHAINESILVDRIPDRVALLAGLLSRL